MKTKFSSLRSLTRKPLALASLVFLILIVIASIIGPFFTGYGYEQTSALQLDPPSKDHFFGTDLHGRDLLTRILFGARISLAVGLIGTMTSLSVGVFYGMISGYLGGRIDMFLMRLVDVLYSLPRLIFVIVLITGLDHMIRNLFGYFGLESFAANTRILLLFIGLGIVQWLTMARIVRGQVLALKEQQFILAAKSLGASKRRILLRHLLPNLGGIIIVYLTLTIPEIILLESLLSFLGLGIQAPQSSWGSLISDGAAAINPIENYWWLLLFPGAAMALTLLSFNLLGDQLRDMLDPRTVKS